MIIHRRKDLRLPEYDYSDPGAYFITIYVKNRHPDLCVTNDGEVDCLEPGKIVWEVWFTLPGRYPGIIVGTAVVMPEHFHGIIHITEEHVRATHELPLHGEERLSRQHMLLPQIIGYFKMQTAKRINLLRGTPGQPFWQRNYYEHVIRNERELEAISDYIIANPANWGYINHDD